MQFNKVLNSQKLSLLTMYMQSVKESSMLLLTPKRGPSTRSFHLFLLLILPLGEILLSLQTLTLPKKMKILLQKQGYLIFSMLFNVLLCKIYLTHHKKAERNMTEKKKIMHRYQFLYFIHFISLPHHLLSPYFLLFAQ